MGDGDGDCAGAGDVPRIGGQFEDIVGPWVGDWEGLVVGAKYGPGVGECSGG